MGGVLERPAREKEIVSFSEGSLHGAVVSMQGWRPSMEDSFLAYPSVSFDKDSGFFAVFDGHGGNYSSAYCASHFLPHLVSRLKDNNIESIPTVEHYSSVMKDCFKSFDSELKTANVKRRSGSTAVIGLITPSHFIIANLGDSRCVLCSKGKPFSLTSDHKPFMENENTRILKSGNLVINGRVNGDLAVSRSFGDFMYKNNESLSQEDQAVSCIPDVVVHERSADDNYIVFACDGVWDAYPDRGEFIDTVNDFLQSYETTELAMSALVDSCISKGSKDNITIILVLLDNPPTPNQVMIQKQKEELQSLVLNV